MASAMIMKRKNTQMITVGPYLCNKPYNKHWY